MAKSIGRHHALARTLWCSDIYDAKIIGLLIDEPKKLTVEMVEQQVEELEGGMLARVFVSCDAALAKADFAVDLSVSWTVSIDAMRRRCGFLLLCELSKNEKNKALDNTFFIGYIAHIQDQFQGEENGVRDAMSVALTGIGRRNRTLNAAAIRAAKAIGRMVVDYGDNARKSIGILTHLESDHLRRKFNRRDAGRVVFSQRLRP
jgi:3-methyladenine DNA glycosylase AlkD